MESIVILRSKVLKSIKRWNYSKKGISTINLNLKIKFPLGGGSVAPVFIALREMMDSSMICIYGSVRKLRRKINYNKYFKDAYDSISACIAETSKQEKLYTGTDSFIHPCKDCPLNTIMNLNCCFNKNENPLVITEMKRKTISIKLCFLLEKIAAHLKDYQFQK